MIVGVSNVDLIELDRAAKDVETFKSYCDSLVPEEFRHVREIMSNQRYLCLMLLRRSKNVSWDKKKEIIEPLMQGLHVVGYSDGLIDLNSMMNLVDRRRLRKFYEKETGV